MDGSALQHALEAGRRLGFAAVARHQPGEVMIEVMSNVAAQAVEINAAGPQDGDRILVVDEGKKKMLERGLFVAPLVGIGERPVKALLEISRQHFAPSLPWVKT